MSGISRIEITESSTTLKKILHQQKTKQKFERVQALYLLKTKQAESVTHVGQILGRNRTTVQRWLSQYQSGGIEALLEVGKSPGRPSQIPREVIARLCEELSDPEGFTSYQEVQIWLEALLDIKVKYDVVHHLVHDKLKASLKVARGKSSQQQPGTIEKFKKELSSQVNSLLEKRTLAQKKYMKIRYWCQDESRFGLKTIERRKLTLRGVKPIGIRQWKREAYYLYGLVEIQTQDSFFCEISHLDTECFQEFLNCFSQAYPKDLHIIQIDNATCHTTKKLVTPENILLLPQPPHCPEVNPIERLWEYLKNFLGWCLFSHLNELKTKVQQILNSLSKQVIASLMRGQFILDALCVANI